MVQFLHDGMKMSSLEVRIEEVAASRLWNRGIGSVSAVVYLQQSDSRKLMVQEIHYKILGTPDVIGDARSERKTLPLVILNSLISVISNSGIRAMSAPFHLELIPKL
jgi:hypothetical protein